jgi:chromatin remodeling complex protein RSC6
VVDSTILSLLAELASLDQQEVLIQQQRRNKRRLLEKAIVKVLKANSKASSKKQKRFGNRQPSGFIRPTLISDELAGFLGKESGTEMARTAVTNLINNYIKTNSLKDLKNGRQINADAKLSSLLKLGKDDVLTYFNLQKYMKHHFIRKPVADAVQQPVA